MTPRDWFAGMAMQPLMSKYPHPEYDYSTVAAMAYRVADAMMERREKYALVQYPESMACDVMDCRLMSNTVRGMRL